MPLIFAAALLSFAHGSNDVANAIGPLAGFYDALTQNSVHARAAIPMWTLVLGALGLGGGLILFGPKVIRTIGSELTGLDAMRAYCIAMADTVTVIIASQPGCAIAATGWRLIFWRRAKISFVRICLTGPPKMVTPTTLADCSDTGSTSGRPWARIPSGSGKPTATVIDCGCWACARRVKRWII